MNNFRLSTCKVDESQMPSPGIVFLQEERDLIINAAPTLEYLEDGRVWDISQNLAVVVPGSCIYEVTTPASGARNFIIRFFQRSSNTYRGRL